MHMYVLHGRYKYERSLVNEVAHAMKRLGSFSFFHATVCLLCNIPGHAIPVPGKYFSQYKILYDKQNKTWLLKNEIATKGICNRLLLAGKPLI